MKKTSKKVATIISGKIIRYVDIELANEVKEMSLGDYLSKASKDRYQTYIHNLGFNGSTLTPYLLKNGYTYMYDNPTKEKSFSKTESDEGSVFNVVIKVDKQKAISFIDSRKILNFKEKQLKKDFLYQPVEEDEELSEDEKLSVVAKSLSIMFEEGHISKTMSSNAWKHWKQIKFTDPETGKVSESKMRNVLPVVSTKVDDFFRAAYIGGWCYINPKYKAKKNKQNPGVTLDVNSLFPAQMYDQEMPWGYPLIYGGEYVEDKKYPLYIQKMKIEWMSLKKGKFPMIQYQGYEKIVSDEYIEECDEITLTLTSVDIETMKECYDLGEITYLGGYKFRSTRQLFKGYIDHWMAIKQDPANKGTARRQLAKWFLNGLYGKFASKVWRKKNSYYLDDTGREITKYEGREDTGTKFYTPISCFICSYARAVTVRGANANYDTFIYADTDSLHLNTTVDNIKGLDIHESDLGKWKLELEFEDSVFLGLKCYGEYGDHKDGKGKRWEFKVAGLPEEAIKDIKTKEDFKLGKEVSCKVAIKTPNGVEYQEKKFTLASSQIGKLKK